MRNGDFESALLWLWPLLWLKGHRSTLEGDWLWRSVVCGAAGVCPENTGLYRSLQPECQKSSAGSAAGLIVHSFLRSNSADVNSYTDFFFVVVVKTIERGGIKPSFLLLSTKKHSFHGNLCFHGTCCIALQRSFIKRHIHTCCHVNVVAFYSTLKENYSKLSFFLRL